MRAIFLIFFISIYSFAITLPTKVYTTIASVNGDSVTLSEPLPYKGMSALVVRNKSNLDYALVFIKSVGGNSAVVIDKDPVGGKNLAKLNPIVNIGDRVIGGFNYDKVLVIAPKEQYNQIVSQLGAKVIDSDIYYAYRASGGNSGYRDFAKKSGIGLVIVSNGNNIEIIDAISEKTILKESLK